MKAFAVVAVIAVVTVAGAGCRTTRPAVAVAAWERNVAQAVPELGMGNWILVTDAAFPAPAGPGVTVQLTGATHVDVLRRVVESLDEVQHLRPTIYVEKEIRYVLEQDVRGVDACRRQMVQALKGRSLRSLSQEELQKKVDEAARFNRVLVLKSDVPVPHAGVYFEVQAAYWTAEAEAALRQRMINTPEPAAGK